MTQISVAPQTMPFIAPAQAPAAPGEAAGPAAAAGEGGLDFAAVLKAQFGQPAKDGAEAEILAALLPAQTTQSDDAAAASELPVAPDLATLLPALAVPLVATTTPAAPGATAGTEIDAAAQPPLAAPVSRPFMAAASVAPPQPQATALSTVKPDGVQLPAPTAHASAAAADASAAVAPSIAAPAQNEARLSAAAEPAMPAAAAEHAAAAGLTNAAAPLVHASQAGDAPAVARIDTPVGSRGWDAEIGQKVVWMVNRMENRAELTLTPPQLGRVEVTISVSGDQTSATFVSASPAAREALEQALPRLREILADAGISLGQASVNAGSTQGGREESPADSRAQEGSRHADQGVRPAEPAWSRRGNGLIDTFA